MNIIDKKLLDSVSEKAQKNERLRINLNFHKSPKEPVQRLLNALEPGTKIAIHRHKKAFETYILLRGKLRVLYYNDQSELTESEILSQQTEKIGINIPPGQWHTIEVLEPGTVIFEVKDGPYSPLLKEDILDPR